MGFRDLDSGLQNLLFAKTMPAGLGEKEWEDLLNSFFSLYYNELVSQVFMQTRTGITDLYDSKEVPYQKWFTINAYYDEQGNWRQLSPGYPSYALRFDINADTVRILRSPAGTSLIVWSVVAMPFTGTFIALADTFAAYGGKALQYLRVNAAENAVESTNVLMLRRVNQAAIPVPASGEIMIWRDSGTGQVWEVYNDPTSGVKSVELT